MVVGHVAGDLEVEGPGLIASPGLGAEVIGEAAETAEEAAAGAADGGECGAGEWAGEAVAGLGLLTVVVVTVTVAAAVAGAGLSAGEHGDDGAVLAIGGHVELIAGDADGFGFAPLAVLFAFAIRDFDDDAFAGQRLFAVDDVEYLAAGWPEVAVVTGGVGG